MEAVGSPGSGPAEEGGVGRDRDLEPSHRYAALAPDELVRSFFDAFGRHDLDAFFAVLDPDVEFRPVDAFGLIGGTGYGLQALRALLEELERGGSAPVVVPRTIEVVDDELVLAVGVISERGQVGGRFASAVAWLFRVREGRILAVFGYPTEAAARRALRDWS
jgi:ketosteroid isomerase-like protein